jgi:hypothetical protein
MGEMSMKICATFVISWTTSEFSGSQETTVKQAQFNTGEVEMSARFVLQK